MLNVLWWFIAVEAIGLAAFPLAFYLLPKLSDRGFSLSKPLGILVVAYAYFLIIRSKNYFFYSMEIMIFRNA